MAAFRTQRLGAGWAADFATQRAKSYRMGIFLFVFHKGYCMLALEGGQADFVLLDLRRAADKYYGEDDGIGPGDPFWPSFNQLWPCAEMLNKDISAIAFGNSDE